MASKNFNQEMRTHLFIQIDQKLQEFPASYEQVRNQNIIANAYSNLKEWNSAADYHQRFYIVRNNNSEESVKKASSAQVYGSFIADLVKSVYEKIYGAQGFRDSTTQREIESCLRNNCPILYNDYQRFYSLVTMISLSEVIRKAIESEMTNIYCLFSLSYTHYLNLKLSPIALGISNYYFEALYSRDDLSKKPDKSATAKITYLSFTGFYSEIDIDVLYQNSDNVQVIMIYDSLTGGPTFNETEFTRDSRVKDCQRSDFRVSKNILLLPLDCSEGKIQSKTIRNIFETIVYRAILDFRPELLVINHSFNFHADGDFPFALKSSAWQKILYNLCLIVSYKVLIVPHKLIGENQYALQTDFNSNECPQLSEFSKKYLPVYSRPWNIKYFEECFTKSLEVLTGMKKFSESSRKRTKPNFSWPGASYSRQLDRVLDFYANHPLYGFLRSIERVKIAKFNQEYYNRYLRAISEDNSAKHYLKDQLQSFNSTTSRTNMKEIQKILNMYGSNTIVLLNPKKLDKVGREESLPSDSFIKDAIFECDLYFDTNVPAYRVQQSQYIVDYANNKLFYFNLWYQRRFSHFEFQIFWDKRTQKGVPIGSPLQHDDIETFFDIGLCATQDKVFWVYGQTANNLSSKDSDRIFYYDQTKKEWVEPKIIAAGHLKQRKARHGVTCSFLEYKQQQILFVCGGDSNQFESKGATMIWNIVEFYYANFKENTLTHHIIDKEKFLFSKATYLPYYHSHAILTEDKVIIFGGGHFSQSVYETEKNKVFCFSITDEKFLPIDAKVEDLTQDKFFKNDTSRSKPILASSPNGLWSNSSYFYINQGRGNEATIVQVRLGRTSSTTNNANDNRLEASLIIFPYKIEKKNLPFLVPAAGFQLKNQGLALKDPKNLIKIVNCLRREDPATVMLFSMFVSCLTRIEKERGILNLIVLKKYIQQLLEDPLFKNKRHKEIGAAAVEVCNIFRGAVLQDQSIRQVMKEIMSEINYLPIERDQAWKQGNDEIIKFVLSNLVTEKEFLIKTLRMEMKYLINDHSLWKIDRIFQRNSHLRQYHAAIFDETTQRWLLDELPRLISMKFEHFREYIKEEDTGILRDLSVNLAKIINFARNNNFSNENHLLVPSDTVENEECEFWEDDNIARDKLILAKCEAHEANKCFGLSSDLFIPENQKIVTDKFTSLLAELALREHLDVPSINSKTANDFMTITEEKWVNLKYSAPEIWRTVAFLLGYTFDPSSIEASGKRRPKKTKGIHLEVIEPASIMKPLQALCSYHCLQNLLSAHKSMGELEGARFFLTSSGSEVYMLKENSLHSVKLAIYNADDNTIYPFYLEENQFSSLCLWNSAAYLHLDMILTKRFLPQRLWQHFSNCLLYSDLGKVFNTESHFSKLIAFVPLLKEEDELFSRSIIADASGIYVLGGYLPRQSKKQPVIPSALCSYYELNTLKDISTNIVEGPLDPMKTQKADLALAQTRDKLFLASRNPLNADEKDFLTLEILDKKSFCWISLFKIPKKPNLSCYSLKICQDSNQKECLMIMIRTVGKKSSAQLIDIDDFQINRAEYEEENNLLNIKRIDNITAEKEDLAIKVALGELNPLPCNYEKDRLESTRSTK